ncbi:hypothetical protein BCR36DRAFT_463489 [Piromyces finnis]|uniref:Uncharacterized protein n=1 Tax=Piromyces finnis TaxID=1754191 RepID=A0A1Y1UW86_9FUNG|nr:hypothetical protein BCR36DRAFT_463489 [Piromyces finnis]|eukprot:ORX42376.1 hypothetical protein BCR36DRAFT_463489 [Piromyces finnis]
MLIFTKNEVIKVSGKVSDDVFKTIYDHSLAYNKISMDALKAIEFKGSYGNNDYNNNDVNKLENAMKYNKNSNQNNLSNNKIRNDLPKSSSINKGTTTITGNKNTKYIKFLY